MHDPHWGLRPALGCCAVLGCCWVIGCGVDLGGTGIPSSLGSAIIDEQNTFSETSDNDLFEAAEAHPLGSATMLLQGTVEGSRDIDVYDLGPVEAFERIVVEMAPDADLKAAIAVFDDNHDALLVNDHRNAYLGKLTPFIDVVFSRASQACYVVVSSTPGFGVRGGYSLVARREAVLTVPQPHPEVVLLDFVGGSNVTIGGRSAITVPVFDAAGIDGAFRGDTDEMVDLVVGYVREDFRGLDVEIRTTSEGDRPAEGMTRLYFGTYDEALLGVAEGVDEFNYVSGQEAIVFTDTFKAFRVIEPSLDEMARALANVASHEIGHLLGLVHTRDVKDIMDVTATLRQLTLDQHFARAPIYADVFPLGHQDSGRYLLDAVGGDEVVVLATRKDARAKVRDASLDVPGESAFSTLKLSSCSLSCGAGGR